MLIDSIYPYVEIVLAGKVWHRRTMLPFAIEASPCRCAENGGDKDVRARLDGLPEERGDRSRVEHVRIRLDR